MSYPRVTYPAGLATGYELSPTPVQGGSMLTLAESACVAPSNPPTVGQAAVCGNIVGVVVTAPTGNDADLVLQTSGIFSQPVKAHDGTTTAAVSIGELLYINATTAVISVDTDDVPYGYALSALSGSATPANICVKLITV